MSTVPFARLPDDARLWVFAATHPLSAEDSAAVLQRVDRFIEGWLAHGRPVVGARELRYDRFLLVGADERASGVSGCSIDSLFHTLQAVERELGITLTDAAPVWFRGDAGEIHSVSRSRFREQITDGQVGEDTVVFNNAVTTVGDVRGGKWEVPLRESWHARAFRVGAGSRGE
jgi:hypothetical protein